MKHIYLGLAALLFAAPALAQQPDPAQAFAQDWQGKVIAEAHVQQSAEALLRAYEAASAEKATLESRLATAMEWLKAAQGQK